MPILYRYLYLSPWRKDQRNGNVTLLDFGMKKSRFPLQNLLSLSNISFLFICETEWVCTREKSWLNVGSLQLKYICVLPWIVSPFLMTSPLPLFLFLSVFPKIRNHTYLILAHKQTHNGNILRAYHYYWFLIRNTI